MVDRLHARYPFLAAARESVDREGVDLAALVEREDAPPVERAIDRVETAIAEGRVGEEHRRPRVELLSYPVARVVVSLVDDRDLTRAYAASEAATAHERFTADREAASLKSTEGQITLQRMLAEFDLADAVAVDEEGPAEIGVRAFLRLATDLEGDDWRLARRDLADGRVAVTREELDALLRAAIRERVAEGLPLSVPGAVREPLAEEVERIESALSDWSVPRDLDLVVPGLFPPCMRKLLSRAQSGESLPDRSAFALLAFLSGIGMDTAEAARLCGRDPEEFAYRVERLRGEAGADYPPPSCATMQAYGDCVNMDDLCEQIDHPATYYCRRVEDGDSPTDWRETVDAG